MILMSMPDMIVHAVFKGAKYFFVTLCAVICYYAAVRYSKMKGSEEEYPEDKEKPPKE